MNKFLFILFFSLNCTANEQIAITKGFEALFIQSGIQANVNMYIKTQEQRIPPKYRPLFGNLMWTLDTIIKQRIEIKIGF